MGCTSLKANQLYRRLNEFELKEHSKTIKSKEDEYTIHYPQHKIGDYFAVGIEDKDYNEFEAKSRQLISKELLSGKKNLLLASKEAFVLSILRNEGMRKKILKIVRNHGLIHAFRWQTWYSLAVNDSTFVPNGNRINKRKAIYNNLIAKSNDEIDEIVDKDVTRTCNHKELFREPTSIGAIQLANVCKAIGGFFPKMGYVQGMNFIVSFLLEVSGMEEFEAFNFLSCFWMKEKNLYYGLYEPGFPMLDFMKFCFKSFLELINVKVFRIIDKIGLPYELWVSKWFLSFFTLGFEKKYILRIFDFLVTADAFGPVYVALAIANQLKKLFMCEDMHQISIVLQSKEKLNTFLNYYEFSKTLKNMNFDHKTKLQLLKDYYKSLSGEEADRFQPFFDKLEKHLLLNKFEYHEDFDFDNEYETVETLFEQRKSKQSEQIVMGGYKVKENVLTDKTNLYQSKSQLNKLKSIDNFKREERKRRKQDKFFQIR